MKHFLIFLSVIFAALLLAVFGKNKSQIGDDTRPLIKAYGTSSFISKWGPGPALKEAFEKTCECRLEWLDSGDINLLLQRLKLEGQQVGADLVLGLDQYDLERASQQIEWRKINNLDNTTWTPEMAAFAQRFNFLPYDWGVLTMVLRKAENRQMPQTLDDYLSDDFKNKISLADPRTSTPGLEFLLWLIQLRGEEGAFQYLKKLEPQVLAYSPNWSAAYGLFSHGQAKMAFSYTTSPLYHLLEEKNSDVVAVEQKEPHPIQVEYFGIPATCHSCELGQRLAQFLLSFEGQKIIMERNYMLPVIPGVKDKTPFATIPQFQILNSNVIPGSAERERILKRWSDLRESN